MFSFPNKFSEKMNIPYYFHVLTLKHVRMMDPSSTLFYHKLPKNQFAAQDKFTLAGSNNQEVFYTQVQVLAILKQSRI